MVIIIKSIEYIAHLLQVEPMENHPWIVKTWNPELKAFVLKHGIIIK